jgi:hypothetical protein
LAGERHVGPARFQEGRPSRRYGAVMHRRALAGSEIVSPHDRHRLYL